MKNWTGSLLFGKVEVDIQLPGETNPESLISNHTQEGIYRKIYPDYASLQTILTCPMFFSAKVVSLKAVVTWVKICIGSTHSFRRICETYTHLLMVYLAIWKALLNDQGKIVYCVVNVEELIMILCNVNTAHILRTTVEILIYSKLLA